MKTKQIIEELKEIGWLIPNEGYRLTLSHKEVKEFIKDVRDIVEESNNTHHLLKKLERG